MTSSSAIAAHTVTKARLMRATLSMGPYGAAVPWRGRTDLAPLCRDCAQGLLASWGCAGDDLIGGGAGGPPPGAGGPSHDVRMITWWKLCADGKPGLGYSMYGLTIGSR